MLSGRLLGSVSILCFVGFKKEMVCKVVNVLISHVHGLYNGLEAIIKKVENYTEVYVSKNVIQKWSNKYKKIYQELTLIVQPTP